MSDGSTLSDQYAFLPGPAYQSGTYHESYPLMADTAMVHNPPQLSYFPGNESQPQSYDGQTLPFGKAVDPTKRDPKSARPTTFWTAEIPTGYNLRPPTKGWGTPEEQQQYAQSHANLSHRQIEYTPVNLLNVHTSPSISTIPRQVAQIIGQHEVLADDNPATVSAGDMYAEKSAPTAWSNLQQSDTLSLDEPGVQTNFPSKGQGQTADHFISTRSGLQPEIVRALPRPSLPSQSDNLSLEDYLETQAPESELEEWTQVGIDHAPVYASYSVLPRGADPVRSGAKKQKKQWARRDSLD